MRNIIMIMLFFNYPNYILLLGDYQLTILHNSDMHARFEQTSRSSGVCNPNEREKCVGGFARLNHIIKQYRLLADNMSDFNVLFLNAGDTYTGTPWFTVHKWKICADFINHIRPDAMSLGNHEFDYGVSGLASFINNVSVPVLATNVDFSDEPTLKNIKKSTIITMGNRKIGIIGYVTKDTIILSTPGKVKFSNEIDAIKRESEELDKFGVKIIIAVGHVGYQMDQLIAKEVPLVDIVIGGHTNTMLCNKQIDNEKCEDVYPKIVQQKTGKIVPVVTAYSYTKYLGVLKVVFDDNGDLKGFSGNPILLDNSIPQDNETLKLLEKYRSKVEEINNEIVGKSRVLLDNEGGKCKFEECSLGNFIADAFVHYVASLPENNVNWTDYPIAFINGGSIRISINPFNLNGNISYGDLLSAQPFDDTLVGIKLSGDDLIRVLERAVLFLGDPSHGEFLQVSGLKVIYKYKLPGTKINSLLVRCGKCLVPTYEPIEKTKIYNVLITQFVAQGGDGFDLIKTIEGKTSINNLNTAEILKWYVSQMESVYAEEQDRIFFGKTDLKLVPEDNNRSDQNMNYPSIILLVSIIIILDN